jgi:CSLREA domain-containing protein
MNDLTKPLYSMVRNCNRRYRFPGMKQAALQITLGCVLFAAAIPGLAENNLASSRFTPGQPLDAMAAGVSSSQAEARLLASLGNNHVLGVSEQITVTNFSDIDDGLCDADCSLREALDAANGLAGGTANIDFDATVFNTPRIINITAALPDISIDLNLAGPGADLLTVRRDSVDNFRIFNIPVSGLNIEMSGLTISNGYPDIMDGGGIRSDSRLVLTAVALDNNQADQGGGVALFAGGEFSHCAFSANQAGRGGGIFFEGGEGDVLQVSNSTISGNVADQGGAIYFLNFDDADQVELSLRSSTIADNTSIWIIVMHTDGEGRSSLTTLDNSILANGGQTNLVGLSGQDATPTFVSLGYNLADDNGSLLLDATGDQIDTDPLLGPLGNNGYSTPTRSLLTGSPAIDAGSCVVSGVADDQRGVARPFDVVAVANVDDGCDSGAFEWTEGIFADGFE